MKALQLGILLFSLTFSLETCLAKEERPSPIIKIFKTIKEHPEIPALFGTRQEKEIEIEIEYDSKNDTVILSKDLQIVELRCKAPFPIKWEYIYKGKPLPLLEVQYKRLSLFGGGNSNISKPSLEDLKNERNNGFMGIVTLPGIIQSQSGRYVCRYFNTRKLNNSYEDAAFLNVFVLGGNNTFNEVNHLMFINKTNVNHVMIPCSVTNPGADVQLFRLNEEALRLHGQHKWERIHVNGKSYKPWEGFKLEAGLGQSLIGDYNCTAISDKDSSIQSIRIIIADISEKEEYERLLIRPKSCWEDEREMKLIRSKRLECFCKDSYALFVNEEEENVEEMNRKADCPLKEEVYGKHRNCSEDWRVEEFFGNEEISQDICYRDKSREGLSGSGARTILKIKANKVSMMDSSSKELANLTVIYDGFPSWADGFKIGIKKRNSTGNVEFELLSKEPDWIQFYPLAHYRAVWRNLIVNLSQVSTLHVFQPDSFSFEWFEVSQKIEGIKIEAGESEISFSLGIPNRNNNFFYAQPCIFIAYITFIYIVGFV